MRLRKAAIADVLWMMFLLLTFIVVMSLQMSFSSTATIDSYVKNIVNEEATRLANSLNGYSTVEANSNMYNSKGKKRDFKNSSDAPAKNYNDDSASVTSIMKLASNDLKSNIQEAFKNNQTLTSRTTSFSSTNSIQDKDITITFKENKKSTSVTVTLKYKVVAHNYTGKSTGYLKKSSLSIPRKVVVTRTIENPLRFK